MPHPFLGIGFTSPLFSKFDREETEALLELTTKSDTTSYQIYVSSTGSGWTYQVDWGDGNIENFDDSTLTPSHTYSSAGVYEIKIYPTGSTTTLFFNQTQSSERSKITMVDGVGSSEWTSFGTAGNLFQFHTNLTSVSSSLDTSNCAIWYGSFFQCFNLTPFPLLDTSSATNMDYTWYQNTSLTSFPLIDTSNVTTMQYAWGGCSGLTSFPPIDTSSVVSTGGNGTATGFYVTWINCSGLTSFPVIDVSSATKLQATWYGCSGLTSFPAIDTSTITIFQQSWYGCSSLTSFPAIDTSSGTNFFMTWYGCSGLTSFPDLTTVNSTPFSAATTFNSCWRGCTNLADFPSGVFDGCTATNFFNAFYDCPSLTADSIENILMDINGANTSNGLLGFGGTTPGESTWTAVALFAKGELVSRGWTIDSNP